MQSQRKAFMDTLTELAERDKSIILIVGDVGFSFIDKFRKKYPKQFFNCGIMEQTMIGVATGMANAGMKPYVYTMKNFILLRPLEQVRNDICYGNVNVKLLGVGGSEAYKFLGMSHNLYGEEEKDLLKNLPNIKTYFPSTESDTAAFVNFEYKRNGPAYFAL